MAVPAPICTRFRWEIPHCVIRSLSGGHAARVRGVFRSARPHGVICADGCRRVKAIRLHCRKVFALPGDDRGSVLFVGSPFLYRDRPHNQDNKRSRVRNMWAECFWMQLDVAGGDHAAGAQSRGKNAGKPERSCGAFIPRRGCRRCGTGGRWRFKDAGVRCICGEKCEDHGGRALGACSQGSCGREGYGHGFTPTVRPRKV